MITIYTCTMDGDMDDNSLYLDYMMAQGPGADQDPVRHGAAAGGAAVH